MAIFMWGSSHLFLAVLPSPSLYLGIEPVRLSVWMPVLSSSPEWWATILLNKKWLFGSMHWERSNLTMAPKCDFPLNFLLNLLSSSILWFVGLCWRHIQMFWLQSNMCLCLGSYLSLAWVNSTFGDWMMWLRQGQFDFDSGWRLTLLWQ